jgi:cytochrome c556
MQRHSYMSKLLPIALSLIVSTAFLSACSDGSKDTHPQQLLTKRIAVFKKMTKTLEPLGLVARGRQDYVKSEFVEGAQALKDLSTQPWAYFTADGNYPPTRAKPEVWSKPEAFKLAQTTFQASVDKLAEVSGSADMAAMGSAVDAVQKSCKSCHEQFRNER